MKKLTMFVVTECPYCKKGYQAIEELKKENPVYNDIPMEIINEDENMDLANEYDYYATPSVFIGKENKIFETKLFDSYETIKGNMKKAFDEVLKD